MQAAPRKGTVILYRSDLLHTDPDNRTARPRRFFGMSIARDMNAPKYWHGGYLPQPSLLDHPLTFGDLLAAPPLLPRAEPYLTMKSAMASATPLPSGSAGSR